MAAVKSSETNWRTRSVTTMMAIITATGRDYSIWPMRETEYNRDIESNNIPTSQLNAITSQRSYNGRNAWLATTIIMINGSDPINETNRIPFL